MQYSNGVYYCCGEPMDSHYNPEPFDMMAVEHEDFVDLECLVCGKEVFDVPA